MKKADSDWVKVWSPFVRLFHWSLVTIIISNMFFNEEGKDWHNRLGYAALVLVCGRIIYGFFGNQFAHISHFFPGLTKIKNDFKNIIQFKFERHLGHTPLASVVMLSMMTLVGLLALTGWMMNLDYFWGNEWLEECHEILSNILLLLALMHFCAVVLVSFVTKENLIASMIHGKKKSQ